MNQFKAMQNMDMMNSMYTVSYTHLDVYKRQVLYFFFYPENGNFSREEADANKNSRRFWRVSKNSGLFVTG